MPPGTLTAVALLAFELGFVWLTMAPLANQGAWAAFQRLTDVTAEQPRRGVRAWLLLAIGAVMLPGVSLRALGRFARSGPASVWRPGALAVLWLAALGSAWVVANTASILLRAPAILPAWRLLGWAHAALAAAVVAYALAATAARVAARVPRA